MKYIGSAGWSICFPFRSETYMEGVRTENCGVIDLDLEKVQRTAVCSNRDEKYEKSFDRYGKQSGAGGAFTVYITDYIPILMVHP